MPVTGENRALIRHGIRIYRGGAGRTGILALMDRLGVRPLHASDVDISFSIIPKLNAAGRMGRVEDAFALLMEEDPAAAAELAETLCDLNTQRRAVEDRIFAEALSRLPDIVTTPIVLADENWHHGVSGIVASRLMERFGVPAVVICIEDGIGRGSCRSWDGFPIYDALSSMSDRLISFGGHAFAAGVNLYAEEIDGFRDALTEYYEKHVSEIKPRLLPIDAELKDLGMLTLKNIEELYTLAPWGNGNQPPMLCLKDARVDQILSIGGDKHVKMRVSRRDGNVECIFFSKRLAELELREGSLCCLAFEPSINDFHGTRTVQLLLRDAVQSGEDEKIRYYLCSSFLGGKDISAEERALLCPSRDELGRLWRALAARRPEINGSRTHVLNMLTEAAEIDEPCRTYISLQVFRELRLISLSERRGLFNIRIPPSAAKVELSDSNILRRLASPEAVKA
jgi:single-stranded-DNA-specific exonuclease